MKLAILPWVAALAGAALLVAAPVAAAVYEADVTVAGSGLSCSKSGDIETCTGTFTPLAPVQLNAGDTYTLNLTFSGGLDVPGSRVEDVVFDGLVDCGATCRFAPPYSVNVSSTLPGYSGPLPLGYSAYTSGTYAASAGFGFGSGGLPNTGFSTDGFDTVFSILQTDPNYIVGFVYGYQFEVPEPATWALMIVGLGVLGAGMRMSRRRSGSPLPA
jgi:hypothetical protein